MTTMRVADYIAITLAENGIKDVFLITGGGAMHLNDAIGRNKDLNYICLHHEQACAIAAESYTRLSGKLCAVNVTTGPGGTNAITGVYGAYVDSIAMVVISGQVKWETTVRSTNILLRQLGDQEIDIVKMVESVTKYAVCIENPESIRYHLEKALFLAKEGRPGPVWIDVPINVQGALVEPGALKPFKPEDEGYANLNSSNAQLKETCKEIVERIKTAQRPVLMVGSGVRIADAREQMLQFAECTGIPVVTAWNAHDLIWDEHPNYVGRPGTIGNRSGNFAVQNSDLLIIVGSRLNIRQVSYNWNSFARFAYKVWVDVDPLELQKPTVTPNLPVVADARAFFETMNSQLVEVKPRIVAGEWLSWCKERLSRYPTVLPEYWNSLKHVNPYCFVEALSQEMSDNEVVVCGNGTACVVAFQAIQLRANQRVFTNSGCASMGYDIPAAIGASLALNKKQIVCIAGDGSIMMNLQELQSLMGLKLPIKIFLLNNNGYHSIRQTQTAFFSDSLMGFDSNNGVTLPSFGRLCDAFGIRYSVCASHESLSAEIKNTLRSTESVLCEVFIDEEQAFSPKLSSRKLSDGRMVSSPLEDMSPFLSREELQENMFYNIIEEAGQ